MSRLLDALAPFHFVGVGGVAMRGIARLLAEAGYSVTGSDAKAGPALASLEEAGVKVTIGHDAAAVPAGSTLVVSSAIRPDNPELAAAADRGQVVLHRAQALALLVRDYKLIAVSGSHGKTTTSAMVAHILAATGRDPTFVVGSDIVGMGTGARRGSGEWAVVEADESDGSLCWFAPDVAVVTNVEPEHLDHYADAAEIEATIAAFAAAVTPDGLVIGSGDDAGALRSLAAVPRSRLRTVGFEGGDASIAASEAQAGGGVLAVNGAEVPLRLGVFGRHNLSNAAAAILAVGPAGVGPSEAAEALQSFAGTSRRFETKGEVRGIRVVDDYAHHPTEVAAALSVARSVASGRVLAIFEPHLYSRTLHLGASIGAALARGADAVALLPIYAAREDPMPGASSDLVAQGAVEARADADVTVCRDRAAVLDWVRERARPGDLIVTVGAGDVTTLGPEILAALAGEPAG